MNDQRAWKAIGAAKRPPHRAGVVFSIAFLDEARIFLGSNLGIEGC
jgi:hypothetical protein